MIESIQDLVYFFLYFNLFVLGLFSVLNVISCVREEKRMRAFDDACVEQLDRPVVSSREVISFQRSDNQLRLERETFKFQKQEKLDLMRKLKQRKKRETLSNRGIDYLFDFTDVKV